MEYRLHQQELDEKLIVESEEIFALGLETGAWNHQTCKVASEWQHRICRPEPGDFKSVVICDGETEVKISSKEKNSI
jgi:hypothetical protein